MRSYACALGSSTEVNNCGNAARTRKITSRIAPTMALRLVRTAPSRPDPPRRDERRGGRAASVGGARGRGVSGGGGRGGRPGAAPRPRVEPGGEEVAEEDGYQDRQGDHQEQ